MPLARVRGLCIFKGHLKTFQIGSMKVILPALRNNFSVRLLIVDIADRNNIKKFIAADKSVDQIHMDRSNIVIQQAQTLA